MKAPIYLKANSSQGLPSWYGPKNAAQWFRRLVSPRSWIVFLVIFTLIFTELHFGWMELLLGNYLTTTNAYRPQSGTIWEHGNQIQSARRALGAYSSQQQNSRLQAQRATSMGQVIAQMADDKGIMISAEHFIELFLGLPPAISHEIVSPYRLLADLSSGYWRRTYFERTDNQVTIYLLDEENQVLQRLPLNPELIEYIQRGEIAVSMGLDRMDGFAGQIYPADHFFKALNGLSENIRAGILSRPEDLLSISGRIVRVGIGSVPQSGMVDLGFEVQGLEGLKVILGQGRYDDVMQLRYALEGRFLGRFSPGEDLP